MIFLNYITDENKFHYARAILDLTILITYSKVFYV